MSLLPLHILMAFISAGGAIVMLLGLVVLRLTLTRRLKKKLKQTGDYWETGTLDFGLMNTTLFAWACVLPYMRRPRMYQNLYPGLEIKEVVGWFEKVVAYGIIGGLSIFFCSSLSLFSLSPD
ncbi:hypothetical protein [uncultured Marinobacter sp.]|uniref:hypothetical protein n=1 Tax=uncultured Marinobacter sp. TaxID=187379 RepID=UPI0030D787EF